MKKPIAEIAKGYYNSNILSHVPNIVTIILGQPFGLLKDPVGDISKKYYNITVESKGEEVFDFIQKKLNIKNEIEKLYFL